MKCPKEPVPRAIAGKDAPRPIAPMSRRRQAAHEKARFGIAKAGNRTSPIVFFAKSRAFFARDLFAPRHQARTAPAADDSCVKRGQFNERHEPQFSTRREDGKTLPGPRLRFLKLRFLQEPGPLPAGPAGEAVRRIGAA